ncbi:LysR family transcriptional regulator [Alcanivorax sp. JB21]|uniref:LysR family transcriptional regulator n=1 Tax=Alcanivorax limicola TaxID=2874102 RepID=UPI001CBCBC9A|nr:LysR family transcriptional regulator [Alcanivorax limicola]MBZ2188527.1 LysR family transcriptional regulator [Alcanivorax limicola]
MNRITDLDVFVAIVKEGTIAGAARRINMAPASVKKRMDRLEADIGTQLLHRSPRSNRMTEVGYRLYQRLAGIFDELDDAVTTVHRYGQMAIGTLRLVISTSLKRRVFESVVAEFGDMYPKVTIEMQFDDRHVDFVRDGCDVAVVLGRPSDSNLVAKKLFDNPCYLCATPEYLAAAGPITDASQLRHHQCLVLDCEGAFKETWPLRTANRTRTTHVKGNMFTNSIDVLYSWVMQGMGIAVLNNEQTKADIRAGRLVQLLPEYTLPNLDYYMVYGSRKSLPARTRQFVRFAESRLLPGGREPQPPA